MRRLRHLDKDPSFESLPPRPINSARGSHSRRSSIATPPREIRSPASRPSSALPPSSARRPKSTNHRSLSPSSADHRHPPTSRRRPRPSSFNPAATATSQHQQFSYYGLDERDLGPAIRLSLVGRGGTNRDVESLEGDLIHIKKELNREREVVRELKTHVARLESDLARRDKAIEILLAKRYSTYQSPGIENIRVNHERSIVVCGLNRQIKGLRGIIQEQAVEMREMAHSQKASTVMELAVEKEEYFYEVMRLREVVKAKDEQLKAGKNHINLLSRQLRHRKISKEDTAMLVEVNHDEQDDEEEEDQAPIFATESPISQPIVRSTPPTCSSYNQEGLPPCHPSINRQQSTPSRRSSTQQSSDSTTPPRRSSSSYDPEGLPPRRPSVSKPQSPPRQRSSIQRSSSTTAIATEPSPPSAAAAVGTPTVPGTTMRQQSRESLVAIERRQSSSAPALGPPPPPVPSFEAGSPLPQIEAQTEEEAKDSTTASRRGSHSKQQRGRSSVETRANRPPELKEEQIDQDEYGLDWFEFTPPQMAKEVIQSDPLPPLSPLDSEEDSESWTSKFEALTAEAPQEEEEKQQQQSQQQQQQAQDAEMVSNVEDPVSRISNLEALVAEVPQEVVEQQQEKEQLQQQGAEISVSRKSEHQARIPEAPQEVGVQQQQRQEAEIGVSEGSDHQGMPLEKLETGEEEEEEQQQQEAEVGVSEGSHHQGMPLEKLETNEEEEKQQQQEAEIVVPEEVHQEISLETMKKREEAAEEQQELVNALPDNHASIATAEEQPPSSSTEDFSTTVEAATKIQAVFRGNSVRSSPPPAGLFPQGDPPGPFLPHSDSSFPPVKQLESSLEEEDKAKEGIEEEANSAVTAEASSAPSDEPLPLSLLVRPPIDRSASGRSSLRSQPLEDLPPMPEAPPVPISKGCKSVTVERGRRGSVGSGSSKSVEEVMSAPAVNMEEGGGEGLNLATELKELLKDEGGGGGGGGMGGEWGLTLADELKELLEDGDEDVGDGLFQIEGGEQQGDGDDWGVPLGQVEGVVTAPAPAVAGLHLATELKELLEGDAVEDGLYQVEGEEQQEDGDDGEDLLGEVDNASLDGGASVYSNDFDLEEGDK